MSTTSKLICIAIALVLLFTVIDAIQLKYRNGREIRAPFKNPEIMVARGFGKRDYYTVGRWWGKRDAATGRNGIAFDDKDKNQINDDFDNESIAIDSMTQELTTNPKLLRAILHRFIDTNKDDLISARELMGTPLDNNDFY